MREELFNLPITRYRDKSGLPTCAIDFPAGKVCPFYGAQKYGTHETCWYANKNGRLWNPVTRRDNGDGSLRPIETCPLWNGGDTHEEPTL